MSEEKVEGGEILAHFRIKNRAPDKNDKLRTELVFDVEYDDPEDDNKTKTGTFIARRPTNGMNSRVSEARLNGGQELGLDRETLIFHRHLAYCFTVLKEAPAWWNPEGSFDSEPLKKIYEHVRHWESSFRPKRVG